MKSSGIRNIRIAVGVILFFIFMFANLFTVRQMARYGMELYFYDKINVAYQTGGMPGLRNELDRVLFEDNMPREAKLAIEFKRDLDEIDDLGIYLNRLTEDLKHKVNRFRNLRNLAFVLIAIVLVLRLIPEVVLRRIKISRMH